MVILLVGHGYLWPIPIGSNIFEFVDVVINYFIKWIKTKALAKDTVANFHKFFKRNTL